MSLSEAERAEIVRRWYGGGSYRTIARAVGVNRKTVAAVIDAHQKQRSQLNLALQAPAKRKSLLDPYEAQIETLLNRYPDLTAVRLHEELQAAGFTGGYTIVKARLRKVRPRPLVEPVVRFETGPGIQAQMDYSPFEIDFLSEGKRRVYAFSYILGYSRRRYLRFVESQDHTTTVREHVRAFEHLGGVATVCLYDSMKVVVHYWDGEQPIYNGRFLAFALHYGFRPWACRRRRPQTKGKVENPFLYIVRNLLNGRSFSSLEHLNTFVAEQWLPMVDRRKHDTTKRPPLEMWEEEREHLVPLPEHPYDTAEVLYRAVGPEWHIPYKQNFYSVPYVRIGQSLPVRVSDKEVIIYSPEVHEIARHELQPPASNRRLTNPKHQPGRDDKRRQEILASRFDELGPDGRAFFEALVSTRRYGKDEAARLLALLATYAQKDLEAALSRARRYRAFSLTAVERILSAQAQPKSPLDTLADEAVRHLDELIADEPVPPRSTSDYLPLLETQEDDHGSENEESS
jgi:transposase